MVDYEYGRLQMPSSIKSGLAIQSEQPNRFAPRIAIALDAGHVGSATVTSFSLYQRRSFLHVQYVWSILALIRVHSVRTFPKCRTTK